MEQNIKELESEFEVDELEDFDLNTEVDIRYEVWIVQDTKEAIVADLIDYFGDEKEAIKCRDFFAEPENLVLLQNRGIVLVAESEITIEVDRVINGEEEIISEKILIKD